MNLYCVYQVARIGDAPGVGAIASGVGAIPHPLQNYNLSGGQGVSYFHGISSIFLSMGLKTRKAIAVAKIVYECCLPVDPTALGS